MNKILSATLAPKTYFSANVYLDEKYILLSPDTPVDEDLLRRLRQWGFGYVFSEGQSVETPAAEVKKSDGMGDSAIELDIKEKEQIKAAAEVFDAMLDFTEKMFTEFVTKNTLPAKMIADRIKGLIETIKNRRTYILRLAELNSPDKNYIIVQSVKSTILALVIGQYLKMPTHKLIELGTACLVHEIGMIRLPPQLYMSDKILSPQEKRAISAHTVLAFKVLRSLSFPMPVCLAVLEHHETVDGSGYPRGIGGDKISMLGKILAVADAYAALISERPYRQGQDGHESIMSLLKDKRHDEAVLKALVYSISIYPIGSFVNLIGGAKAVVVDVNPENPRFPMVKLLTGAGGERIKEPLIVSTHEKEYSISRMMNPDEIRAFH